MSDQSYKELAIPYFKEVFDRIDAIMQHHRIPYYLIGVNAIALEFLKKGVMPARATKDVDFAIMIASVSDYKDLTESFKESGFRKLEAPWTFRSEEFDVIVDVLPFGGIEEESAAPFTGKSVELHVLGLKEVLEHPVSVNIGDKIAYIPSLPGMVILKLMAWSDRPEERENDLADILKIIEHYFNYNFEEIVSKHHDILIQEPFDERAFSAQVLGREARFYLNKSEKLSGRVLSVVNDNLDAAAGSRVAREWARRKNWTIEYALNLLKSFKQGLTEP